MRHTEFWRRMGDALGEQYAEFWAGATVLGALDDRTPREALDAGVPPKQVWRAVWEALELPTAQR